MIKVNTLVNLLKKNKSDFFTGVPDSILKELSILLQSKSKKNHIISTNEGSAVSIGIGYYLSTKKLPLFRTKTQPTQTQTISHLRYE